MDEKYELLVDIFFDRMHHNADIVYPYYADPEYAHNIANDYLNEHPDFQVPPKDKTEAYLFDSKELFALKQYCDAKCEYYEYNKEPEE